MKCISLGIPIPIVAISAGIAHDQYGHENLLVAIFYLATYSHVFHNLININCWIDHDKGAVWGFVAPMLAIIIVSASNCFHICKFF